MLRHFPDRPFFDGFVFEKNTVFRGFYFMADIAEQGRFSCTIRTDNSNKFALFNIKADILKNRNLFVSVGYVVNLQHHIDFLYFIKIAMKTGAPIIAVRIPIGSSDGCTILLLSVSANNKINAPSKADNGNIIT